MAKLYFYNGAMSSSKSMNLLMAAYNYEAQGKRVLVFTSGLDDRSGLNIIQSRVGPKRTALPVHKETNIYEAVKEDIASNGRLHCVLLDEVQFYDEVHIEQLTRIADDLDIPVLAYGLKTDFRGKLFPGAKALLEQADKVTEIKTVCTFCNKKATHNLRTNNKIPVYTGEVIQIGDEEYFPVCRKHHKHPVLSPEGEILLPEPSFR